MQRLAVAIQGELIIGGTGDDLGAQVRNGLGA